MPHHLIGDHQRVKAGDIIVAMSSGSRAVVGKTARATQEWDGGFGAFCGLLRPLGHVIDKYVSWFTSSAEYRNKVSELAAGVNINNLKPAHFDDIEIPLPPLAEQREIADRLDTVLAQVDTLKGRLDALPGILKRFRQSVLAAAVSGKLTEEWRGNGAYKEDNDITIPTTWSAQAAKTICKKVQSGSTPRDKPFDQKGTIPFLKVYNIVDQKINFDYRPQFITEETHSEKLKRSIALPDDILMNIVGPPLGKVAMLTNQYPQWNFNQAITLFRADTEKLLPKFLYLVLCEGALVRKVMPDTKGSVGQINISLTQCRESIVPVPPFEEQGRIVRRVEQLFAFADQVEQRVKEAQGRVNNLTQSILAKAFRGELTAEWREQHPELISGENSASALLARIQAERAAQTPIKRTRKKKASA